MEENDTDQIYKNDRIWAAGDGRKTFGNENNMHLLQLQRTKQWRGVE